MPVGDIFKFVHNLEIENSRLRVALAFQTCFSFWLAVEYLKEISKKEKIITKKGA